MDRVYLVVPFGLSAVNFNSKNRGHMALTKEEINRKLLHLFSGSAIPIGIFYLPKIEGTSEYIAVLILGVLLLFSLALELIRFKFPSVQKLFMGLGSSMLRKDEDVRFTGATWIFASAFICSIIFFKEPHISFIVISLFIFGDAIAAIVGLSIGRIKIGKKSLEGSLACFCLSFLFLFIFFPRIPNLLEVWDGSIPLLLSIIIAFSITLQELFPITIRSFSINDNLSVPLITGLLIRYTYPLFFS